MSEYLNEAAEQLRTIARNIDKREAAAGPSGAYSEERHELAKAFAELAAVERGLKSPDTAGAALTHAMNDQTSKKGK